jgi:hypothetical protein
MEKEDKTLFQMMAEMRGDDPLLDLVMKSFEQADAIYQEARKAMGELPENLESTSSSAKVVWCFSQDE